MEFIIRYIPSPNGLQSMYEPSIQEQLRQHLDGAGVAVNPIHGYHGYSSWTITKDSSILPYDDDDFDSRVSCEGVELVSRVLPVGDVGFQEIREVVALVRGKFDVKLNMTTGLHIHVGNGSASFEDECIQNLAQLVTVFEHQIEAIHPQSRMHIYWAQPPSDNEALKASEGPFASAEVLQESGKDVVDVINYGKLRAAAYNLTNLVEISETKRTIEFRQHQGSMDADQIVAWADFVTGLVSYCHEVSPERFLKLILRFGTDKDFSVLHLMEIIGKPHLVEYYRDKLIHRERPRIALPNPTAGSSEELGQC